MEATGNRLERCYTELGKVKAMTEEEVCALYNADTKEEIIALIQEEITALEDNYGSLPDDDGTDYVRLQLSQGLPVLYW